MQPGDFNFAEPASSTTGRIYQRRKTPWWQSSGAIIAGVLLLAALGGLAVVMLNRPEPPSIELAEAEPFSVKESTPWAYRPGLKYQGIAKSSLKFELVDAPTGMTIDPQSGEMSWTPGEADGPGTFAFKVKAASGELFAERPLEIAVEEVDRAPLFDALPHREAQPGESVEVTATAKDPDQPARAIRYALDSPSEPGAELDETNGSFTWLVPREISPGQYRFRIRASEVGGELAESAELLVTVKAPSAPADPFEQLAEALRKEGATVSLLDNPPAFPTISAQGRTFRINGGDVKVFQYPSATQLERDAARISAENESPAQNLHVFRGLAELAVYQGTNKATLLALESHFGSPLALSPSKKDIPEPTETLPEVDPDLELLAELFDRERLSVKESYPKLRKLFADRFARKHDAIFQEAWGSEYREMMDWLNARPEIREELFNAVDPKHDKIVEAFRLFSTLRKEFPERIEDYAHLAIAVSLVWDQPSGGGIVNYAHHAHRTHSKMPEDLLSGIEIFRYFVEAEVSMQGRAKFLPWEFLAWIVNDRTPLQERKWALQNYLKRRSMIGKCYHDVPYDTEMLRTQSQVCRLDGKDYALPNIRQFGGVCAMQADFASRVAKSLGVPAEYVAGESRGGERHAWVMWVELLDVNKGQIKFSLESHGRYRGDKYYVGELRDAQTGRRITDRILERKLHVVGMNPTAKRHADLAVKAVDLVAQNQSLSVKDTMTALLQILKLCPGHEPAWRQLASLAGSEEIDREERRMMVRALDSLFKTFAKFPDFTWTIFADITRYEKDPRAKIELYQKLLALYGSAGRPDLACDAALATVDLLVKDDRSADAVKGLGATILRFADEGRYVPQMLDRLEELYTQQGGSGAELVSFYQKLLPKIPPKRGNSPSPYAIEMYRRAIEAFKKNQRNDLAAALDVKLKQLEAGN